MEKQADGEYISREAVQELSQKLVYTTRDKADYLCNFWEELRKLQGVAIPPKVGQWIYDGTIDNWRCTKCDKPPKIRGYVGTLEFMEEHFKYCPNCGSYNGDNLDGMISDKLTTEDGEPDGVGQFFCP